jgi:hypothetical protein
MADEKIVQTAINTIRTLSIKNNHNINPFYL